MPAMSVWVNLLDYSCAILPVTLADKNIDVKDPHYNPMNGEDEKVYQACGFSPWALGGSCSLIESR
jgi:hypothetical protein